MKIEIAKFEGIINFGLWQVQVYNTLIQSSYTRKEKSNVNPIPLVETLEGV